jgi:sterol 3beta-glucosyltransferase
MKFAVITYGTQGDARPLTAICRTLIDMGHEARLLADAATLDAAHALGVPTSPLAGDIRRALRPNGAISGVITQGAQLGRTARALASIANTNATAWLRATIEAGQGCDALIVSGLAAFVGLSAAEYIGIRAIGMGLIPITPTSSFASPFLPPNRVPPMLNRASHHLVNQMLWRTFRKATNEARARVCGKLWTDHPILYGVSPSLLPRPADWPDNALLCGQWAISSAEWSPPKALTQFLAAGEPPLYIGFGSMVVFGSEPLLGAIVAAVAGRRALFYPGWSGLDTSKLPHNFLVIGDTPHSWLFPKVSLVVHHGGSGTTHSAATAGVPSVMIPFAGDQFFWAQRLHKIGAAAKAVNRNPLQAGALARAIDFAEQSQIRAQACELGERMRAEDGLQTAITMIETIMSRPR